nr:hypothetical protein [Tanacetum cinerariifolium]
MIPISKATKPTSRMVSEPLLAAVCSTLAVFCWRFSILLSCLESLFRAKRCTKVGLVALAAGASATATEDWAARAGAAETATRLAGAGAATGVAATAGASATTGAASGVAGSGWAATTWADISAAGDAGACTALAVAKSDLVETVAKSARLQEL